MLFDKHNQLGTTDTFVSAPIGIFIRDRFTISPGTYKTVISNARGFGTSVFNMVPKGRYMVSPHVLCFGTSVFNMVPKVVNRVRGGFKRFGTSVFNMVPKD